LRRPVLIIQADSFNRSRIQTVLVAALTTNELLASAPGNVLVRAKRSGLRTTSVVNVSQISTLDRQFLLEKIGVLPANLLEEVDAGLRMVLDLP
jgi:mRNA interferase MazF